MRRSILVLSLVRCDVSSATTPAPPAAFTVEDDVVRMHGDTPRALRPTTAPAVEGHALPGPPVTARVTTMPELTAPSYAPLAGRVQAVLVRLGDRVAPGDRLVRVQTTDLPEIKHALSSAKLAVKTRTAIVDRMRRLVQSRVGSEHDLIVAQSELAEAELAVKTARARLSSLSVAPEGDSAYWVLAHRAGTVVQLDAAEGKQVGPDRGEPLVTVADLHEVLIVGDVSPRDAAALRPGMSAEVRVTGGSSPAAHGKIVAVADVVDPERQTVPVRVHADNAGELRPNGYVELVFEPPPGVRVLVPAAAVVSDGASAQVFVEESPGVLRRRAVELGRRSKTTIEVRAGLAAGERVVTSGALLLLNALETET